MMTKSERERCMRCLLACAELYGKEVGEGAGALWLDALQGLPIAAIEEGFARHVRDPGAGKYMPRPADIIAQAQGSDGRPDADEAWSLVPRDERQTTVWTDETAAAFGVCVDLIGERDSSAARMAFRSAYEREVREARAAGKAVRWFVSFGFDASQREAPVLRAIEKGRLPQSAVALLPSPPPAQNVLVHVGQNVIKGMK